jgi:peptide/nickel transport system substrate-binding protein
LRKPMSVVAALLIAMSAAACSNNGSTSASTATGTAAAKGGDLVIVRGGDSVSMDNTMVFSNASIWVFQQMLESLYEVAPDGKSVRPLLATSHTVSPDKLTWTFKLKQGVTFSNGSPMTSADVKFSLDKARSTKGGWEFLDVAIASVAAPKYKWAPFLADIALFANGIIPKDFNGESRTSSTSTRSAPARSCGTSASSASR